jgi:hypothetical protein
VRVSCARSPIGATDAGNERPIRPAGHVAADPGQDTLPEVTHAGCTGLVSLFGTVASSSARHGRLRRNAVSPHGVRLSGAPGAPLWIGYSSANRALAGKLLWDGIVAVPKVFGAGCPVLFSTGEPSPEEPAAGEHGQTGGSANWRGRGQAVQPPGRSPAHLPDLQTQSLQERGGGTGRRMEEREALRDSWTFGGYQSSADQFRPPGGPLYRVDGPSGFTQAAENHGRTISERHNRTPQRRAWRV